MTNREATETSTPFAHLQSELAARYREVLSVFVRAKDRFVVHLRPEDVYADLGHSIELEAITAALTQLDKWGNLRADPDTGRVTSPEDFNRARYLYQLTAAGQAAEQAITVYEEAIGRRGALQSVALADIASQLHALLALAAETANSGFPPDAARSHLLLLSVSERFAGLADNAQAFMASLRRTIDFADTDVEVFLAYKERLISYIERFIADLANQGAEIARLAYQIEQIGIAPILEIAARREAADAVPDSVNDAFDLAFNDAAARWQRRWIGLRDWFVSGDSRKASQAKLLRTAAIAAITQLLGTVASLNERRSGRSDRSADFRTLAGWFARASDEQAHRLWRAAFGMSAARHLTVTEATLQAWEERQPIASTPWREAPPLEISPQLRRTGSYERRGQPNRIIERAHARSLLAEKAHLEAEQARLARARLSTGRQILLSELAELEPASFRQFLGLLGDALAARPPGADEVDVTTSDGIMRVRLTAVDNAPTVKIRTLDGILSGPEHLIEITDLTSPQRMVVQ